MRAVDFLHRWAGALLGLVLAVLGLTGAVLVHKEEWIGLPHAGDSRTADAGTLGRLSEQLMAAPTAGDSLIYPTDRLGLLQLRRLDGSGLYASHGGEIVARWSSQWERPELWIFDLHHHLFAGETGETIAGIAGLAAVIFSLTGALLWWRTRRTFRLRLWPRRLSGPAIRMQHRDLGIVVAPMLLLTGLTGAMLIFRPVAAAVLSPFGPATAIETDLAAPALTSAPLSGHLDLAAVVKASHQAFPQAQLRILALPKKSGAPVTVRMKQPGEWLPNGRTMLWFDATSGRLLARRDASTMHQATKAFNVVYPIHAAKVGGWPYRIVLTLTGLALALLGLLATSSFLTGKRSSSVRG